MTLSKGDRFIEIQTMGLAFLGEQDGPNERSLKQSLIIVFKETEYIDAAYLVRCTLGSSCSETIVLALQSAMDVDLNVVEKIKEVFASIFSEQEHLDILLMDQDQERRVSSVCSPFYRVR